MEASVRYIPTEITSVQGFTRATGNKPALCFRGTKKAHCVINDELNVHVVTIPLDIHDKSQPVPGHWGNGQYSPARFREFILHKIAKPVTLQARRLLDSLGEDKPFDPDDLPDEPEVAPLPGVRAAAGPSIVATVAAEMKLPGSKVRKLLRAAGLRAPYEDEAAIRAALAPKGQPKPVEAKKEPTPPTKKEAKNGAKAAGKPPRSSKGLDLAKELSGAIFGKKSKAKSASKKKKKSTKR